MMAKGTKAYALWKQMKPGALRRLALAVFLVFGVVGPLTALMESELHLVSWMFIFVQTLATGGMAASIILLGRKKWWVTMFIIMLWCGVLVLNSGAISFIVDDRGLRVEFGGVNKKPHERHTTGEITLKPSELDTIYTQRGLIGTFAIVLLASGYGMFISVIGKELKQRTRLETEMKIAQDIQLSLLPESTTNLSWCIAAGTTVPATEVGGDYFDIVKISDDKLALVIADVAGHGVGAGILSAMTKSAFHLQLDHDPSPVQVLENLNRTLYNLSDEKMFVTFAYAVMDNSTHRIQIATAGHPPILHYQFKTKKVTPLRTVSLALGIKSDAQYSSLEVLCERGDAVLLYTDGVVEVMSAKDEQFGTERLEQMLLKGADTAEGICSNIITALHAFSGKDVFQDDVSLVCVKLI